jgi:hypothetical protein
MTSQLTYGTSSDNRIIMKGVDAQHRVAGNKIGKYSTSQMARRHRKKTEQMSRASGLIYI